jgi:hypothetical protein
MSNDQGELLTATKWAEKFGVSESKLKKAIKENNIEPDAKKGVCGYYSPQTAEKIKKLIK